MFYRNPINQYRQPRFKVGENVHISKKDIPFRKGYKSQFTKEIFKIVEIATINHQPITFVENKVMKFWVSFMNKSFQSVSFKDEFFHC